MKHPLCRLFGALAWGLVQKVRGPAHAGYEVMSQPPVQTVVATGRVAAVSRAQVGSPLTGMGVERRYRKAMRHWSGIADGRRTHRQPRQQVLREVFGLFRTFNREFGCAVLLVTHDSRLWQQCDRTVTLVDGKIESDKSAADMT